MPGNDGVRIVQKWDDSGEERVAPKEGSPMLRLRNIGIPQVTGPVCSAMTSLYFREMLKCHKCIDKQTNYGNIAPLCWRA